MKRPCGSKIVFGMVAACFSLMSIAVIPISAEGKDQQPLQTKPLPALIDLGRRTCIPCKMMAPILDELKRDYAGILNVEFVDVDENRDAAKKYGILGIPTQIFFDVTGKELARHLGYISKEQILAEFKRLGVELETQKQMKK